MTLEIPELTDARLTLEDSIAWLTFDRDDVRNVLTGTALIDDLEQTVDFVNAEPSVAVLVISGAGKAFSAGGNLKEMLGRNDAHAEGPYSGDAETVRRKYQAGIQRIPRAMARLIKPSIAAVNGPAIGAGFDLVMMADLRIASRTARFGETFVNLGLISGIGGAWWLTRELGHQQAARLTLLGEVFDTREALQLGLILEVTEPEMLVERAGKLAQRLAAQPPYALSQNKQLLMAARSSDLASFLDACADVQGRCHNQDDHLEAVQAFLDGRAGQYSGQ